jgi:DNA-binding FadR family transcriptional regulator
MPADEAEKPTPRKSVRREPNPTTMLRRPQKMSEHTARKVVAEIIGSGLGAGDRLPSVPSMAEQYGVGYASVREALRMLESIGLIQVRPGPNGGPVVNDRDGAEFSSVIRLYCQIMGVTYRHIIAARQALEPILVRELAIGGTPDLRVALLEATSHEMGPGTAFRAQARNFHDVIASYSASNPVLSLFARAVGQIYREFIRSAGPSIEPADRPEVHAEHRAIAEAVAAGDGARAEELMAQHMADLGEYVETHYAMALDSVIEWV